MTKTKVALIGYRGMVGSVLMERMAAESDFELFAPTLFSTSQAGKPAPDVTGKGKDLGLLEDAFDTKRLAEFDIVLTCQGGSYTEKVYPELRSSGWNGYWIDAASTLRMNDDTIICLDPVNHETLKSGIKDGVKNFVGGNCTVSLLLLAIGGLFEKGLVEWVSSMTYQAASGAGAQNMAELIDQMKCLGSALKPEAQGALELDQNVTDLLHSNSFPKTHFGAPLAGNFLPWIDTKVEDGQSREEWKAMSEGNKILATKTAIPIDGTCVRVGAMRSHGQALTVKLTKDLPMDEIEKLIGSHNDWVKVIPNEKEETVQKLTPAAVSGTLDIAVGRLRKLKMGPEYLNVFTVGDQLLWGAAEPLRRMLRILLER